MCRCQLESGCRPVVQLYPSEASASIQYPTPRGLQTPWTMRVRQYLQRALYKPPSSLFINQLLSSLVSDAALWQERCSRSHMDCRLQRACSDILAASNEIETPVSDLPGTTSLCSCFLLAVEVHARRSSEMMLSLVRTRLEMVLLDAFCTSASESHHPSSFCNAVTARVYRSTFCSLLENSTQDVSAEEAAVTIATHDTRSYRANTDADAPKRRMNTCIARA
mmetsp:Transcript_12047/g.31627  ORF Transcript_12047/g.31627 Transcript_12047/m.31627 type:complete len:222 (-) Transcript_12047:68-733(-)